MRSSVIGLTPDAAQLADIALSSADHRGPACELGGPRVPPIRPVRPATAPMWRRWPKPPGHPRRPPADLPVEGLIQYDAAIDPVVARAKLPGSDVAGRATVFIFPDLNTGNNTYKAVQRPAGAVAVGPVL